MRNCTRFVQALQQQRRSLPAPLARIGGERGQRRYRDRRLGNIIEAGNGEVAARADAARIQAQHQAERDGIVVADRRTRAMAIGKQLIGARRGFQPVRRRLDHPARRQRQTGLGQRLLETGTALVARARCGVAAEESNLAMAALNQVARGQIGTVLVVQGQEIPVGPFQLAVEQQHVGIGAQRLPQQRGIAALGRRQDQAGRGVLHQRGQHRLLTLRRFSGAAEQGHVTASTQRLIHTGGELGEERVGQIVDHQRDARRGPPAQVGRRAVVDIALAAQFGLDLGAGIDVDQWAATQHQRHGCP
jgi:hypothetical protein